MKTKKIVIISLFFVFMSLLTACSKTTKKAYVRTDKEGNVITKATAANEKVNTEMAQLYISNFNGGFGTEWLYNRVNAFCELYKDYSFTQGTKGVQIWVETTKSTKQEQIGSERNEIYFCENLNYYDLVTQGKLVDITDMVTEKLTAYGENVSIEDKLEDSYKNYFKASNGKYYGLPHYKSVYCMTYDADLFNESDLFMSDEGEFECKNTDTNLSSGPDGIKGTYDDGLPATYSDFYKLCQTMKQRGIDPLMWSGAYGFYTTLFLNQLKADYEGSEYNLFTSFSGTATKLVNSVSGDGVVSFKEPTTISLNNGYELYSSAGIYNSLSFLETIIKNGWYCSDALNESVSHTDAQYKFLLSKYSSKLNSIGMLVEGSWWPHESEDKFISMASKYNNSSLEERNLKIMPYPKADESLVGKGTTILDVSNSVACISSSIAPEKLELAKKFLQFLETDESLYSTFKITNMVRSFKLTLNNEQYNSLNTFAQSYYDVVSNANVVIPLSSDEFFYKNYSAFIPEYTYQTNKYGLNPVDSLKKSNVTALDIFNEVKNKYTSEQWQLLVNK